MSLQGSIESRKNTLKSSQYITSWAVTLWTSEVENYDNQKLDPWDPSTVSSYKLYVLSNHLSTILLKFVAYLKK